MTPSPHSDYPCRPVLIVEPFGQGGGPDLLARALAGPPSRTARRAGWRSPSPEVEVVGSVCPCAYGIRRFSALKPARRWTSEYQCYRCSDHFGS